MAKRERVDFAPQLEEIGVFADAGNAFVTPEAPRGTALNAGQNAQRLASALSGLNKNLQGFVRQNITEANRQTRENRSRFQREEQQRGRNAASKAAAAAGKAVIDGIIPPGASPYYIMGLKQQQGRLLAKDHQSGLNDAFQNLNPLNGDPQAANNEFNKKFREENPSLSDPQISSGFDSIRNSTESALRAQFFSRRNVALRKQKSDQTGIEAGDFLEGIWERAVTNGQVPDYEKAGLFLNELLRADRFQGLGGTASLEAVASAVIQHAEAYTSTSAFKALDLPYEDSQNPGHMLPAPSKNPRIKKMIAISEDKIEREIKAEENEAKRARAHNKGEATDAYSNWIYSKLKSDRAFRPSQDEIARWVNQGVSDVGMKYERVRGAVTNQIPSSPKMLGTVRMMVLTGEIGSQEELFEAITGFDSEDRGRIKINFDEYAQFSELVRRAQKDGSVLRDPQYTQGVQDLLFDLKVDKNNMTGEPLYDIDGSAVANFKLFRGDIREEYATRYADAVDGKDLTSTDKTAISASIRKELKEEYFPKIYTDAAAKLKEEIVFGLDTFSLDILSNPLSSEHARFIQKHFPRGLEGNQRTIYLALVRKAIAKKAGDEAAAAPQPRKTAAEAVGEPGKPAGFFQ